MLKLLVGPILKLPVGPILKLPVGQILKLPVGPILKLPVCPVYTTNIKCRSHVGILNKNYPYVYQITEKRCPYQWHVRDFLLLIFM